jgi:hypothetical protein
VRVSGPRHAARIGQIRRAPHEHLTRAADLAEVPGRPRDGGQERAFQHQARASRPDARLDAARPSTPARAATMAERRQETMEARGHRRPNERDEATAERAERAFAGRRSGAHR